MIHTGGSSDVAHVPPPRPYGQGKDTRDPMRIVVCCSLSPEPSAWPCLMSTWDDMEGHWAGRRSHGGGCWWLGTWLPHGWAWCPVLTLLLLSTTQDDVWAASMTSDTPPHWMRTISTAGDKKKKPCGCNFYPKSSCGFSVLTMSCLCFISVLCFLLLCRDVLMTEDIHRRALSGTNSTIWHVMKVKIH